MSLGMIALLIAFGALTGAVVLRARGYASSTRGSVAGPQRSKASIGMPRATEMPDGKRCAEIAGGPLDLMADYEVGHPHWPLAVEDD